MCMLVSEPFCVFPYVYPVLRKTLVFEFLEHVPKKFLACFMRVRANDVT